MSISGRYVAMVFGALVVLGLGVMACDSGDDGPGPPLPSVETMTFNISAFQGGGKADKADEPVVGEKANFNNAAARVWWLNASIAAHLVVPVLVFAAAANTEPTWDSGVWTWEFSVGNGANTSTAVLSGWYDGDLKEGIFLNLAMAITCPGCKTPVTDYVWYDGRFNTDGGDGHWQFYNPDIENDDQSLVRIAYDYTDASNKVLELTNNRVDGHEDAGDIISYIVAGDQATIEVHDASEGLDYEAHWSIETTAGTFTVPGYNNGEEACWDAQHINIDCQ
jgi:hypothetical protein